MRWYPRWQHFRFRQSRSFTGEEHSLSEKNRQFVLFFTSSLLISSVLFWGPALYIIKQNQNTLTSLYMDQNPSLILGLDQEFLWLQISFIVGFLVMGIAAYTLTRKMATEMSKPLLWIERSLKELHQNPQVRLQVPSDLNHLILQRFVEYVQSHQESRSEESEILANIEIPISDKKNFMLVDLLRRRIWAEMSQLPNPSSSSHSISGKSAKPGAAASGRLVS